MSTLLWQQILHACKHQSYIVMNGNWNIAQKSYQWDTYFLTCYSTSFRFLWFLSWAIKFELKLRIYKTLEGNSTLMTVINLICIFVELDTKWGVKCKIGSCMFYMLCRLSVFSRPYIQSKMTQVFASLKVRWKKSEGESK